MTKRSPHTRARLEKAGLTPIRGVFTKGVKAWLREKNLERAAIRREKKVFAEQLALSKEVIEEILEEERTNGK